MSTNGDIVLLFFNGRLPTAHPHSYNANAASFPSGCTVQAQISDLLDHKELVISLYIWINDSQIELSLCT